MKTDIVVSKLRELKLKYTEDKLWQDPAHLPNYLAEFLGYATILYSHYAEFIVSYRKKEGTVLVDENDEMRSINKDAVKREDRRTADEKNDRITIRMANLKGEREKLEAEVKSATLHINGIQSLMKRFSDEAKGGM